MYNVGIKVDVVASLFGAQSVHTLHQWLPDVWIVWSVAVALFIITLIITAIIFTTLL
jgi:hypothetical protein